jgi:hypothetical protein
MNGSRLPDIEYFLSSGFSFLAVSFSLLAEFMSFDGLGVAAIFSAGLADVFFGAAAVFDGAVVLVPGVDGVLVEITFTSGFAEIGAVLAGTMAGLAAVVFAFAGTTAGLAVLVAAVAGTAFAGTIAGFAVVVAVFAGGAAGFAGIATGLIEITAGLGAVCAWAADGLAGTAPEGFACEVGALAVGCGVALVVV